MMAPITMAAMIPVMVMMIPSILGTGWTRRAICRGRDD
jgi:hypothetical protein